MYDVVIVGGSAAGLSAALVLGRSRRSVLVCDTHEPRNRPSPTAHSIFTRDGIPPADLLLIGRAQLEAYSVEFRSVAVTRAQTNDRQVFLLGLANGEELRSRRVLLATGVRDVLPLIAGIEQFWGTSVLHCPYCHGWEVRDQPIAVLSACETAVYLAYLLRNWSRDLALCTNGSGQLSEAERARIRSLNVQIYEQPIARLEGTESQLEGIRFADGTLLKRRSLFVRTAQEQRSRLAHDLGCEIGEGGIIHVDEQGQTSVAGVYAAGDMTRHMQQIIFAAADGARAAMAINHSFVQEEIRLAA
ncbi:MAG TPA: NAD(P)/FAD-dependent oxidoreductase [Roseiflexaceae bacterium]|nr:NAD(P)/FAD-dependent oxidoreductase [Roseiflexaceae bacterium]